jgi:putative transposase
VGCLSSVASETANSEKTRIVDELRPTFLLAKLLESIDLCRSTYYYQMDLARAGDRYAELKARIRASFDLHLGRYGYRRVTAELCRNGEAVDPKTVQRLMQEMGLKSTVRPKKYKSYKGIEGETANNTIDRDFEATRPNEKWVTDVTEFKVAGEKLYLSPVLDLYNREIVAFTMDTRPSLNLVTSMLAEALEKLPGEDTPLMHSDQGWHYRMPKYQSALKERGIVQSMSRKGNCYDNAVMENFFGLLKTEYFYQTKFTSVEQLREGITKYIDYYNNDRIKAKLGWLSPVEYRTQRATPMAASN